MNDVFGMTLQFLSLEYLIFFPALLYFCIGRHMLIIFVVYCLAASNGLATGKTVHVVVKYLVQKPEARICKPFKEPRNSQPPRPVRRPYLSYRYDRLHRLA